MTQLEAKRIVQGLGLTFRRTDGEYRIALRTPDNEASAYYTCDLDDALATAERMAREVGNAY